MLHKLFIVLFMMFILGNFVYYAQTNTLSNLTLGLFTGVLVSILITGVLSSINVLGSGLNASGSWLIFSVSFYATLLFGVTIPLSLFSDKLKDIPLGANLVGNLINITPYPINVLVTILGILLLVVGVNIIIGGRTGGG